MPQNIADNRISETGIARITLADAQRLTKYRMQPGDVVYSRRGDVERRALVREYEDGWLCGTGCLRIRFGNDVVYPRYAAHYLGHPAVREWIVRHAHGATMPNLNTSILAGVPFVLPPWDEQVAIGDAAEAFDSKIELNRRINQTLEAMAQAIFKSWFVDFDPVKAKIAAKAEGRDPLRAAMTAISGKPDAELDTLPPDQFAPLAATAALFPDEMQDSELGEIPKGWEIQQLPKVIDFLEGPGIRNWQYTDAEDGVRFINIRCIKDGDLKLDTASKITVEEAFGKYRHFQLAEDDIVISISGTLGRFGFVRKIHLPLSLNTSVVRFRPIPSRSTLHFVAGFVDTQLQIELETRASGSAQRNFGPMHLKQIKILMPQYELQQMHSKIADRLFRMRQSSLSQIDTLTALRDTLLPKLLSGELKVQGAEAEAAA